jgi:hypothetical protein
MVNFRWFRFVAGALYEKSREYERVRPLSAAIFVILGAQSKFSRAAEDQQTVPQSAFKKTLNSRLSCRTSSGIWKRMPETALDSGSSPE